MAIGGHKVTPAAALDVTGGGLFTQAVRLPHLIGSSAVPAATAGSGAGSGTVSVSGSDLAGQLLLTTGSAPVAGGVIAQLTFSGAYTTAPFVSLTAVNDNAAGVAAFVTSTTTGFTLTLKSGSALSPSSEYRFSFHVLQ